MKPRSVAFLLVSAVMLVGCQAEDPVQVATARSKPIADAYVYAWNTGDLDTLDAICDMNIVRHDPLVGNQEGLDAVKKHIQLIRSMYPDFKVTIEEEFYVGDRAMVYWTMSGTNTGPGMFPPTGKAFETGGLSLSKLVNGKLGEERAMYDRMDMMQQLGFQLLAPGQQ